MSDDSSNNGGVSWGDTISTVTGGAGDSVTEVTSQSWFSRLAGAVMGVLIGAILFVVSFPLLWWNEGRAVHTAQGLAELKQTVIDAPADRVDPAHDKRPVHVSGEATSSQTLTDGEFSIAVPALKLRRTVEMYQWKETEETRTQKRLGGGEETIHTWNYNRGWFDHVIDSRHFHAAAGHSNPDTMRVENREQLASDVRLGAFRVPQTLLEQLGNYDPLPLDADALAKLPEGLRKQAQLANNTIYLPNAADAGKVDPSSPRVGDVRVRFSAVRPGPVSVVAEQTGESFQPWTSRNGEHFQRLVPGTFSADEMVGQMQAENERLTWILRLVGFLLMAFGLGLVANPLAVVADVIPFLGDLLRTGVVFFAGLMALCLSLVVIAVAWLAFRPLLGAALLAAALGLLVVFKMRAAQRRPPAPAATPPGGGDFSVGR